jgi:uncharacterized protein YbjT (DUF2867 family)
MHIILGGTGHVGSAAAMSLLRQGEAVTIVTRDPSKCADWTRRGAEIAVADVHDSEALRQVFRQGERLFLLNPPADPSTDTDVEERKTVAAITFEGMGFSKAAAKSYARMTAVTLDDLELPDSPERGTVSLQRYISDLVTRHN